MTKKKNIYLTETIKLRIVDAILNSPMNIAVIPDELEQQMYFLILDAIEEMNDSCACKSSWFTCQK